MNSIAPQEVWRSEAFAEDLFNDSIGGDGLSHANRPAHINSILLCALPVVVALLGGVVAFFHTIG